MKQYRLGLGTVAIGLDNTGINPIISFRKEPKERKIGEDIKSKGKPQDKAEFVLEIVGLDGLETLQFMLDKAKEKLKFEEELLEMYVRFDHILKLGE